MKSEIRKRNSFVFFAIFFLSVLCGLNFSSCGNSDIIEKQREKDKVITREGAKKDSLRQVKTDTVGKIRVRLTSAKRTKGEVQKLVNDIDKLSKQDKSKWGDNVSGSGGDPTIIEKLYSDAGELVMMRCGWGDCSMLMMEDRFYFHDKELVGLKTYAIYRNFNPCMNEREMKESGITGSYKKKNTKEQFESYFLLDNEHLDFNRKGRIESLKPDTMSIINIQRSAEVYINLKEN